MSALDVRGPGWMADAVCASTDPAIFHPEKGSSTRQAKAICAVCPVRVQCLAYAVDNHLDDGLWGGLTARERQVARRGAA